MHTYSAESVFDNRHLYEPHCLVAVVENLLTPLTSFFNKFLPLIYAFGLIFIFHKGINKNGQIQLNLRGNRSIYSIKITGNFFSMLFKSFHTEF